MKHVSCIVCLYHEASPLFLSLKQQHCDHLEVRLFGRRIPLVKLPRHPNTLESIWTTFKNMPKTPSQEVCGCLGTAVNHFLLGSILIHIIHCVLLFILLPGSLSFGLVDRTDSHLHSIAINMGRVSPINQW